MKLDHLLQSTCYLPKLKILETKQLADLQPIDTPQPTLSISELNIQCEWRPKPGFAQLVRFRPRIETLRLGIRDFRDFDSRSYDLVNFLGMLSGA